MRYSRQNAAGLAPTELATAFSRRSLLCSSACMSPIESLRFYFGILASLPSAGQFSSELGREWRECMGIEPTRSLFPNPSPVLKTGAGTSRTRTPVNVGKRQHVARSVRTRISRLLARICRWKTPLARDSTKVFGLAWLGFFVRTILMVSVPENAVPLARPELTRCVHLSTYRFCWRVFCLDFYDGVVLIKPQHVKDLAYSNTVQVAPTTGPNG
jgi:hypothetical protein